MRPVLIPAFNPGPLTGRGNNTYLGSASGVLIDAGVGEPRHLDAIDDALSSTLLPSLRQVLVTHAHDDHASGAPAIGQRWPTAVFSKMLWPERDHRFPVEWQPLADGVSIDCGDSTLTAVHTPGHAPDHLVFWDRSAGTIFSGDLVVSGGTVVIPVSQGGNLLEYLASLERVLALDPIRLFPAHGPAIDRPAAVLRDYIRHRLQREDQIVTALRQGCRRPSEIVRRVYQGLAPGLDAAAGENVLAHLVKLAIEGRATRDGDDWEAR